MTATPGTTAASPAAGGRRRAALINKEGPPAPPAPPPLSIADVDRLKNDRGLETRATFARKFGRHFDHLQEEHTQTLTRAILDLLLKDVEKRVRQALAEEVSTSDTLPREVALSLARDEIDIARPMLENSSVLTDDDLQDIVRTHAMQYALAVAGRERLSERLTTTLAEVGDSQVVRRMICNAGAELSEKTLQSVAASHRSDPEVQSGLIRRPALPYELVDQLVDDIGNRLEWELVKKRRMSAVEARQLMRAVRDKATLNIVAREYGSNQIERDLRRRMSEGELGPDEILIHLRDGEVRHVEAGLAVLAGTDFDHARAMLYGPDRRKIAALCLRAGFSTAHYTMLRMALDLVESGVSQKADVRYSNEMMRHNQLQYEQMKTDPQLVDSLFET